MLTQSGFQQINIYGFYKINLFRGMDYYLQ
jgi:hypothetical protein